MELSEVKNYPLSEKDLTRLNRIMKSSEPYQIRRRAHAILLVFQDYKSFDDVGSILRVHSNSIRNWSERWIGENIEGLYDLEGRGAKPIFSPEDEKYILKSIEKEPQSLRKVAEMVEKQTGKKAGVETFRRLFKKNGKIWKRQRKITKGKPEPAQYEQAATDVEQLKQMAADGEFKLYFMDESGFSLTPTVPYAWQDRGRKGTIGIPSAHSKRINYLGLLNPTEHALEAFPFEGSIDSAALIDAIDQFVDTLTSPVVVIADNAPTHKSKAFTAKLPDWERRGLTIYFISPYSPELNLIEILWRKIKYEWLPNSAYEGLDRLRLALADIFESYGGEKYSINFS